MGSELVAAEKSWLDVAKEAANVDRSPLLSEDRSLFKNIITPAWFDDIDVPGEKVSEVREGTSGLLTSLPLTAIEAVQTGQGRVSGLETTDDQNFVKELKNILASTDRLSKQKFLDVVGPYLLTLKSGEGKSSKETGKSTGGRRNGLTDDVYEESILFSLRSSVKHLSQRPVSLILECCIALKFWEPVRLLLVRKAVVSVSSPRLVEAFIDDEQPQLLVRYIDHVPDIAPEDVFSMLAYFLDNVGQPPRCFQPVKIEWRTAVRKEIDRALKSKEALQVAASNAAPRNLEKLGTERGKYTRVAYSLAIAVDGFNPAEYCIHHLLAFGPDECMLSAVVSRLSSQQVLRLTQYLIKWIERYSSSYLANFPVPKYHKIPALSPVLSWAAVILEEHFTQLILSPAFHKDLKTMRSLVQDLVTFGTSISPLSSMSEHIMLNSSLPSLKQQQEDDSRSDYVIELLDMS